MDTPHVRAIAMVGKVVERFAVGRECTIALVRPRRAVYQDGAPVLLFLGKFHRPDIAASRERDAFATREKRIVAKPVVVVCI